MGTAVRGATNPATPGASPSPQSDEVEERVMLIPERAATVDILPKKRAKLERTTMIKGLTRGANRAECSLFLNQRGEVRGGGWWAVVL